MSDQCEEHTEASAKAWGARPSCPPPPRAPSSRYSPARLPPTPPAPPLSLALAEPSGPALRAPLARPTRDPVLFDHDLDPQAYPPVRVPICGGSLDRDAHVPV